MNTLWTIPLAPLAGAAINGLAGSLLPRRVVTGVAWLASAAAFFFALAAALGFVSSGHIAYSQNYGSWIHFGSLAIDYKLSLDALSTVMILVVSGVGLLIHIYSAGYMAHEDGYWRYFSYLNLFLFFMLTLALAGNLALMFVGWEGVGLASYLLIGFFYKKESAAAAGMKAFLTNRVGDLGLLLAMFLLIAQVGSLDFERILYALGAQPVGSWLPTTVALLLLLAACGKSAQFPLHVWLPDAMEGPTPVSALIHAATMVTAGVYLICRTAPIFDRAPAAQIAVMSVGAFTALMAALIALAQTDIKRVLAYSTISQLGYMFMAAGAAAYSAAIFHLFTHAFFKALLFLGAGSVIHALNGEQDLFRMGGLRKKLPVTYVVMTIGVCAIAGIPGLSGFFSKDEILWRSLNAPGGLIFWSVGALTALLTSFYSFRLLLLTFFGAEKHEGHAHESPAIMLGPLVILAFFAATAGYLNLPRAMGGGEWFSAFLGESPAGEQHSLQLVFAAISAMIAIIGFVLARAFYLVDTQRPARIAEGLSGIHQLLRGKFYVDELYDFLLRRPLLFAADKLLGAGVEEGVVGGAAQEIEKGATGASSLLREAASGNLRSYASWLAAGATMLILYMAWAAR